MFVALGREIEYVKTGVFLLLHHHLVVVLLFHLLLSLVLHDVLSLGLLVGLGGSVVARQRHVVAVPQLVELGGLVLAAAGGAVPEAGQRGAHLHALHRHRALDGLAKLKDAEGDLSTLANSRPAPVEIITRLASDDVLARNSARTTDHE